jgi:hypothetical protein
MMNCPSRKIEWFVYYIGKEKEEASRFSPLPTAHDRFTLEAYSLTVSI